MQKKAPPKKLLDFKKTVWTYYRTHKRSMPWREDTSLYSIVVSEIMLQQTQVSRVTIKFDSWMERFPDWRSLAKAPIKDVLREWSGLGYNRRALYLKRIAETVMSDPHRFTLGKQRFPQVKWTKEDSASSLYESLRELSGIGPNTAGAIMAYAFNVPYPFIETNIRSAFIHFFFKDRGSKIHDDEIRLILGHLLKEPDIKKNAREWCWALMDHGSYVKSMHPNPSRKSAHHIRQKPFKGSNRELRSQILQLVMKEPRTLTSIQKNIGSPTKANKRSSDRSSSLKTIAQNVSDLIKEGFIARTKGSKLAIPH